MHHIEQSVNQMIWRLNKIFVTLQQDKYTL